MPLGSSRRTSGLILNSSLPNIPYPFWGWFFCSTLTISLPWFHRELQPEAAGGAPWVRRITRHSWALYLPETARFEYLVDRPEAEDIGGAINAAMKAIADENEELGGALPRKYNSLKKLNIEQYIKGNFGSDAMTVK